MLQKTRFCIPEIFFGMLLAVALFLMGAMFWSSQYPGQSTQAPSASHRADEETQGQQHEGLWNWLTHDAAGFFTTWLVIVGGGQLVLFYIQLKLIRESLTDAEQLAETAKLQAQIADATLKSSQDTAKRQLRAYMGHEPNGAHFEPQWNAAAGIFENRGPVKYFERNYGGTPATNVSMHVRVIEGLNPPIDFEKDVPKLEVMQTVFPGQGVGKIVDPAKRRQHRFFLYGYIDYDDVFGGKWRRRFAFTHDPDRPGRGDDSWVAYHRNNDENERT
jgi:hypothetical protein